MEMVLTKSVTKGHSHTTDNELRAKGKGPVSDESALPEQVSKSLVQLFKLLSDETRLKILFYLMKQDELNVRALCDLLGQSQPAVSHHLALLRVAGLIESRRDGKHNFYHILPRRFQELLGMIFDAAPDEDGSIRFEDFELTYAPVDGDNHQH